MAILVNQQRIEDEWIKTETAAAKERLKQELPGADPLRVDLQAREWARETVIRRTLLQQAGYASVEDLMVRLGETVPRPKPKEVTNYYRQFSNQFHVPDLIRASHIVKNVDEGSSDVQAEEAIREIAERLKQGGDFAELADQFSDCPGRGGDLGYFGRGDMVEEFDTAVWNLPVGGTSEIFRSPFGFHIARLTERQPAGVRSLNDVRGQIEELLWNDKKYQAAEAFLQQLRERAEIRKA